jgi:hypothetical protein
MKTFFKSLKNEVQRSVPQSTHPLTLTRAFVETGDERCPLAGIWSRLPELDAAADDEPGLTWPVRGVLLFKALPWRAADFVSSGIHKFAISY